MSAKHYNLNIEERDQLEVMAHGLAAILAKLVPDKVELTMAKVNIESDDVREQNELHLLLRSENQALRKIRDDYHKSLANAHGDIGRRDESIKALWEQIRGGEDAIVALKKKLITAQREAWDEGYNVAWRDKRGVEGNPYGTA